MPATFENHPESQKQYQEKCAEALAQDVADRMAHGVKIEIGDSIQHTPPPTQGMNNRREWHQPTTETITAQIMAHALHILDGGCSKTEPSSPALIEILRDAETEEPSN